MAENASFIIKDDKYTFSIIKKHKPNNKKSKRGISIFKKNLELNELNDDNINMILKSPKNENIFYSYANIGFISISGVNCFAYCTEKDVKEIGSIRLIKIYQVRNINYIILDPDMDKSTKKAILKFFKEYSRYEINKGLIFAQDLLNLDLSFDVFYHHLYDINQNIFHINPNINFCYNYEYMGYFRKFSLEDFTTHLTCGYYFQNPMKIHQKEEMNLHLIIKDNEKDKEQENEKILREIEVFLTPVDISIHQIFHFLFFSYIGDYLKDDNLLYNLLKSNQPENKKDNGSIIIIDVQNKIKGKQSAEINKFIIFMKNKLNKELGYNYKIIFIQQKNDIESIIKNNKDIIDDIKYNYELKGIEFLIEFQQKQLLIISDNEINSLRIIENILYLIDYKFINKYEEMINKNEISDYLKTVMKTYRNYIKIKNNNFLKIEKIPSEPLNEDYLNKNLFINKKKEEIKENIEQIEFDFGSLEDKSNNILLKNKQNEKNNNININEILEGQNANIGLINNKIFLYIVTFNVANYDLENGYNEKLLKKLLFPEEIKNHFSKNTFPTFYCIGLQEIVKLNTSNIIFASNKNVYLWEAKITQLLQKHYNYTLQYKENLVGILFLFFVKASEAKKVDSTEKLVVKAGFLNKLGNKGYILYEFKYNNKNISFCTGHLTAGQNNKNYQNRAQLLIDILNHKNEKTSNKFYQNDFYFLFGDMNFRVKVEPNEFFQDVDKIQLSNKKINDDSIIRNKSLLGEDIFIPYVDERGKRVRYSSVEKIDVVNNFDYLEEKVKVKEKISMNNINSIQIDNIELLYKRTIGEEQFKYYFLNKFSENEELNELKKTLGIYEINEHRIKFLPTYKYIKGNKLYNVSKRIPSWTDRILFKKSKDIRCLFYNKIDLNISDHRPVFALFEIEMENISK